MPGECKGKVNRRAPDMSLDDFKDVPNERESVTAMSDFWFILTRLCLSLGRPVCLFIINSRPKDKQDEPGLFQPSFSFWILLLAVSFLVLSRRPEKNKKKEKEKRDQAIDRSLTSRPKARQRLDGRSLNRLLFFFPLVVYRRRLSFLFSCDAAVDRRPR